MFMSNSLRITPRIRKEIHVIINCVSSLNVISLVMGKLETIKYKEQINHDQCGHLVTVKHWECAGPG